ESAAQQSEMLEAFNNHYSRIVERINDHGFGIEVTAEYADRPNAIPLPATLTIDVGRDLGECGKSGMQVRLYSDHPFRSRKDGGPRDDFEREALARLRANPDEPYYRFEDLGGRPFLRYATARRMQDGGIRCHKVQPARTTND